MQATVLPQYQGPSKKGIKVESNIFDGMKFGILRSNNACQEIDVSFLSCHV